MKNKKTVLNLLTWLCATLFFISCGGDDSSGEGPYLNATPRYVNLEATESVNISVSSNTSWDVTSDRDWLHVSPTGGSSNGSISIHGDDNTTGADRTAHITIKATRANVSADITVTQKAKSETPKTEDPVLTVAPSALSFSASSGSEMITITSNQEWTITSTQDWCTVNKTSGLSNSTVTVSVTANPNTSNRKATITIKGGNITREVSVTQDGKQPDPILTVSPSSLSFSASDGSDNFTITSNVSWTVTSSESWCSVDKTSGSDNSTVKVTVTANPNTTDRTATITVKGGDITRRVTITQKAKDPDPYLTVSPSSLSFSASGGSSSFTISSNISWTVSSNQSWCTVNKTSGSNDGIISVSVTSNSNTYDRTATITVKGSNITRTITITQGPKDPDPYLTVSPSSLSFSASSGSNSFTISSNISWTVSSSESWCTVNKKSGSNDGTVSVSVTANPDAADRSATITVKGGSISRTVSVTQTKKASSSVGRDEYGDDRNLNGY